MAGIVGVLRDLMDDNLSYYYYVILEDWSNSSAIVLICASIVYFIYAILFAFMNAIPAAPRKREMIEEHTKGGKDEDEK